VRSKPVCHFNDSKEHVARGDASGRQDTGSFPAKKQRIHKDGGGVKNTVCTLVPEGMQCEQEVQPTGRLQ
jgi:hypothetical protein